MTITTIALSATAIALSVLFFHPQLLKSSIWRATVTPLASIIGSGFLIAGPILAHVAGNLAWLAMIGLSAAAYLFGAAIRHNIAHVEPTFRSGARPFVLGIERLSNVALSIAYFVSVAYYLNLFAAFGLRLGHVVDPFWIRLTATTVIASIGVIGALGGLSGLERIEVGVVGLKLVLIGGLFAALSVASLMAAANGTFDWPQATHAHGLKEVSILLGLVLLVQGFETSRYLGSKYDADMRATTMRYAQWLSAAIYIVFILLITRYFFDNLPERGGETAIIDMLAPLGTIVGPVIIIMALASQLSAAIADMNGAGGLLAESTNQRLRVRSGNLITALIAIIVTWSANIYVIIAYASKLFAAYYALQSMQAALSTWRRRQFGYGALFFAGFILAAIVIVFAISADA